MGQAVSVCPGPAPPSVDPAALESDTACETHVLSGVTSGLILMDCFRNVP